MENILVLLKQERTEDRVEPAITFNESAFKHGATKADIRNAFLTLKLDMALDDEAEKFVLVGFDINANLIEVMYNITEDNVIDVFHAMKCCKKYRDLIER